MTLLALEPVGGIAGDMMLAALLHLGAPRAALDEGLAALAEASGAIDLRGTRGTRTVYVRILFIIFMLWSIANSQHRC